MPPTKSASLSPKVIPAFAAFRAFAGFPAFPARPRVIRPRLLRSGDRLRSPARSSLPLVRSRWPQIMMMMHPISCVSPIHDILINEISFELNYENLN